jgi:hypothetical protein
MPWNINDDGSVSPASGYEHDDFGPSPKYTVTPLAGDAPTGFVMDPNLVSDFFANKYDPYVLVWVHDGHDCARKDATTGEDNSRNRLTLRKKSDIPKDPLVSVVKWIPAPEPARSTEWTGSCGLRPEGEVVLQGGNFYHMREQLLHQRPKMNNLDALRTLAPLFNCTKYLHDPPFEYA